MTVYDTTKVRQDWVDQQLHDLGTISRFAEKLKVHPSTASRWIDPTAEATGRFVGAVLNNFAVDFDTAFITVREEQKARTPRRTAA